MRIQEKVEVEVPLQSYIYDEQKIVICYFFSAITNAALYTYVFDIFYINISYAAS